MLDALLVGHAIRAAVLTIFVAVSAAQKSDECAATGPVAGGASGHRA